MSNSKKVGWAKYEFIIEFNQLLESMQFYKSYKACVSEASYCKFIKGAMVSIFLTIIKCVQFCCIPPELLPKKICTRSSEVKVINLFLSKINPETSLRPR